VEFSRDWLAQYVDLPPLEELSRGLTAIGLTEEGMTPRGEDVVLDIDVTTNRPDCMNFLGLAREAAVRFGSVLKRPELTLVESGGATADAIAVELADGKGCPRYVARVVRGVSVGPSPDWLRRRLEGIGARSINNIVDITNFVLWETGQPIHAFDLAKIAGARIVVRRAVAGERLVTLDEVERELSPDVLVIADAERAVALAGIMGGRDSEVTEKTVDILIESAHFDPAVVRAGAGRLDMHTDASHRFERGADPEGALWAADRVASLVAEVAGGEVLAGRVDARSDHLPGSLSGWLDHLRLEAFGGLEIQRGEVERILTGLGFDLTPVGPERWRVAVPSWRYHDMKYVGPSGEVYESDLFEEVLRHVGFDNVPSALPPVEAPDSGSSAAYDHRQSVRRFLSATGLAEAINYSFHAGADDGRFGIWSSEWPVRLANPLSELYDTMRRSLMSGLVASAEFNQRRGAPAVRLFEVGHLFPGPGRPEVETVAMVLGGTVGSPWQRATELDLFDLKGIVEGLAERFGVAIESRPGLLPGVVAGTGATLHSGRRGAIVGWMGQLALDGPPYALFGAELEVAALQSGERFSTLAAPSRLPGIAVDLTLTHAATVAWLDLEAAITEAAVADLASWSLKDRYEGKGVPAGAVNTTINFVYNAAERSLTQEEVNQRQRALSDSLEAEFGWREG
jgi:phenylalanyl-tRNA synthetase beta chain